MQRISVDLPEPEGPDRRQTTSPVRHVEVDAVAAPSKAP